MAYISSVVIMAATGFLLMQWLAKGAIPEELYFDAHPADRVILVLEIVLAVYITILCFRYKNASGFC